MLLRVFAVVFASLFLSGCYNLVDNRVILGAGAGAGVGAAIGAATGGGAGAAIGAGVGAGVGGVIGYMVRPDGCFIRNVRGEIWQVPCDARMAANHCYVGNDLWGLREVACPPWYFAERPRRKVRARAPEPDDDTEPEPAPPAAATPPAAAPSPAAAPAPPPAPKN